MKSLGILDRLTHPPTLSWDVEAAKPESKIFESACKACGEEPVEGVIMVGDELKAWVNIAQYS
jgi:FMN phosphatase YigB (HAD superfamily)